MPDNIVRRPPIGAQNLENTKLDPRFLYVSIVPDVNVRQVGVDEPVSDVSTDAATGGINYTALVPFPTTRLFNVREVYPVPPLATATVPDTPFTPT